jgi:hypothetical protein
MFRFPLMDVKPVSGIEAGTQAEGGRIQGAKKYKGC